MAFAAITFSACDDDTLNMGQSLTTESDQVNLMSTSYPVTTRTVVADHILSRNNDCYFGRIKDPETGTYVSSEFMTQLNILETFYLFDKNTIVGRYNDMAAADSCVLYLYMSNLTASADTLAAMKMRMVEMGVPTEETQSYYTNFDPEAEGYLRTDGLVANKMFSFSDMTIKDSIRNAKGYYHSIHIPLNKPYTDQAGNTYNNYGTYVMQQYYRHPEYFKNAYTFIHNVCPGFFFQITDGTGFYAKIPEIGMHVYYRTNIDDSIKSRTLTLAGTDEVMRTTKISNDTEKLQQLADDPTCTYIKSPVGLFTEVTLPIDEIMSKHENDSLLGASIQFQRLNNSKEDVKNLEVPEILMMIAKDSLESFFSTSHLTDSKTSYLCSYSYNTQGSFYNSDLQSQNLYTFSNISDMISHLAMSKRKGVAADPYWVEKHPNWNKVLLVPVKLKTMNNSSYSSSAPSITGIEHNSALTSTKLIGSNQSPIVINMYIGQFKGK